jgi:hypothetical protein
MVNDYPTYSGFKTVKGNGHIAIVRRCCSQTGEAGKRNSSPPF